MRQDYDYRTPKAPLNRIVITKDPFWQASEIKKSILLVITPLLAGGLTLMTFYLAHHFLTAGSLLKRILLAQGELQQVIIPFIIVLMFFWSFFDMLLKALTTTRLHKDLRNETISIVHETVMNNGIEFTLDLLHRLRGGIKERLVGRRILSLMNHLYHNEDPIRCHEFIRHQLEIDSDTIIAGYTTTRIFVWAMPILGFIGTVMGIGISIGGFSNFLGGGTGNISVIIEKLGYVTSGLSFAFDTTLLGLVASLIGMLLATFVQNKNEKLITELDGLCLKIIAAFKPRSRPPGQVPAEADISLVESVAMLKNILDLTNANLNEFNRIFKRSLKENNEEWRSLVSTLNASVEPFKTILDQLIKQRC